MENDKKYQIFIVFEKETVSDASVLT